jgi:hypothetical protein
LRVAISASRDLNVLSIAFLIHFTIAPSGDAAARAGRQVAPSDVIPLHDKWLLEAVPRELRSTCHGRENFSIDASRVPCFYVMLAISNYPCEMTTAPPPAARIWTRRLSDKLRLVFHAACDEAEFSAAEQRLNQLCKHITSPSSNPTRLDRRRPEDLSGVSERLGNLLLWQLENRAEPAAPADEDHLSRRRRT